MDQRPVADVDQAELASMLRELASAAAAWVADASCIDDVLSPRP
ncbi:hypothetical protein ACFY0A_39175 [Streptomyces sp. NPDC001698]